MTRGLGPAAERSAPHIHTGVVMVLLMFLLRRIGAHVLLLAGLGIMGMAFTTFAHGQDKRSDDTEKGVIGPKQVDWKKKKYTVEFRDRKWEDVLLWLASESKLVYSAHHKPPPGIVFFIAPAGQEYSLLEIFDIVNRRLQTEKLTLLRGDTDLSLLPADAEIPGRWIPRVPFKELADRGQTEIVEMVIELNTTLNAEEVAPELKRLLSDFGRVTPLASLNKLIVRDTVANLRRVLWRIPGPLPTGSNNHTLSHKCMYVRASTAAAVLTQALGQSSQVGPGVIRVKDYTITSDQASNTVIVNGPDDKIEQAMTILKSLDVPSNSGPIRVGPPMFMYHEVPDGNAEAMEKVLKEIYKEDDSIRIMVANPYRLFVWADPQTHHEIDMTFRVRHLQNEMNEATDQRRQCTSPSGAAPVCRFARVRGLRRIGAACRRTCR